MKKTLFLIFLIGIFPSFVFTQTDDTEKVEKTGGIFPTEAQGDETSEIPANRSELIKVPKRTRPQFSNELKIAARTQNEIRPNYYVMEGYVDLTYQGFRLQADRAEFDAKTKDLIATGNVVLDQANQHLTGDHLELNLETKKGSMHNARGFVPPQIFFWGTRLDKIGEDEYKLYDGVFTECSQIVPHWRLNTTSARMTINEYIHFKNFTLKAKTIPIFYSPYMMWPIKRDRSTGFLFPGFGPNSRKGFWVGGSFFWAMTKSMDSTYWVDHYADRGFGGGAEYRYAASKEEDGNVKMYVTDDSLLGTEWTIHGAVNQKLPLDFTAKGVVDYFSSFAYVRDYSNNLSRALSLTRQFQGFLTRNWSYYSLNFLNNYVERESNNDSTSYFSHLPEVEFRSRSQRLGPTPFYGALLTSYDQLGQGRNFTDGSEIKNTFHRYDIFPSISWPVTYLSWLTVTPTYAYRMTHWSMQRDETGFVDDPLTRRYSELTLDLRGPNFGKVFDSPGMGYSKKWKHAIEPQVTYRHRQDIANQRNVIGVDSDVDFVEGTRSVTYSITNLLYAKRPVKEEEEYDPDEYHYYDPEPLVPPVESAWEFISWKIAQTYQFESDSFNPNNPNLRAFSPIGSVIRVNPSQHYNVQFSTDYDINFHQLTRLQVGSTLRDVGHWYSNISYVYSNPASLQVLPGQPRRRAGNSLQTNGGVGLWKNRIALNGEIGYDFTSNGLLGGGFGVTWNDDCFSVGVQYRHFNEIFRSDGKENQITFSLSLPNIGNLVSFQSGAPAKRF